MENKVIDEFLQMAKEMGICRDQLENFLSAGYLPFPWQLKFHLACRDADKDNSAVKIGVGGARGPGKSHAVFAQITLDDCKRLDGLKCLFIRQTGIAAKESFEDLIYKVLGNCKYEYNRSSNTLLFPNKSKVLLGGFRDDRDIDNYIGIEYDLIAVEELNQLSFERINRLLGSLRTSKTGWRPRMYASFNPGGKGHGDVKKLFIEPYEKQCEVETKFIPSTYRENPYLNKEYVDYLKSLQGDLGKAWRDGNWDVFEGQYFTEWNREYHTCEPFEVPSTWKRIRSIDHGRAAPTACLWGAVDYDGNIWWYREYYQAGVDADINAQKICELSKGESYAFTVMDSSCFSKTGSGETIAEIYSRNGVLAEPSPKDRIAGWNLFHEYLRLVDKKPKMVWMKNCVNSIRTIPTLIYYDRNRVMTDARVEDLDSTGEDHCADTVSYALQYLHESRSPKPKDPLEVKLEQFKAKYKVVPKNLNDFYSNKK